MESGWLALISVVFGLVLGATFVAVVSAAARRGAHASRVVDPAVPDGVDQMIDALDSAGVVLDPSNNVVKASQAAYLYGLIVNDTLAHPELLELAASVRRTGEPESALLTLPRGPFGEAELYLAARVARLGTRYVLLLADDRTEAHRVEEVRRDFIANISHELKTPIGAISLLSEALEPAADNPEQVRRFAERLSSEASRLARITTEIIELSRLQAADVITDATAMSIDDVIESAIDQNRVMADANEDTIVIGEPTGARVLGDERLLVAAVKNLIENAIQYSPQRSRIGVGTHVSDQAVEISVTDQGYGIPEEDVDRVFERFFRVDQARSRSTGGTGLGLSIVKHVVENHGGDVRVWSQPGRGSTFTIRLPLLVEDAPGPANN